MRTALLMGLVLLGLLAPGPARAQTEPATTTPDDTQPATEPAELETEAAPDAETTPTESAEAAPPSSDEPTAEPASGHEAEPDTESVDETSSPGPLVPPGGVPEILDPNAQGEPRRRPRPRPAPEPPAAPLPVSSMRVEIQPRFNLSLGSSFDDALEAHRYSSSLPIFGGHVGLAFSVVEPWFWIGGRLGLRGRTWQHPDREGPVATAGTLVATVGVRADVGRVVEFAALLYGGAGVVDLQINGVAAGQLVPHFGVEVGMAFRVGPNFSFGPRLGWEYFQWDGVNAAGHWLEMGGPFLGVSLEGRE